MGEPIIKTEHSPAPQPERAIYGFFLLIAGVFLTFLYTFVAFLPDSTLDSIGLGYLTGIKYWLVSLPAFFTVLIALLFPIWLSIMMMNTKSYEAIDNLVDDKSLKKKVKFSEDSIDPIYDLDKLKICELLYLDNQ